MNGGENQAHCLRPLESWPTKNRDTNGQLPHHQMELAALRPIYISKFFSRGLNPEPIVAVENVTNNFDGISRKNLD